MRSPEDDARLASAPTSEAMPSWQIALIVLAILVIGAIIAALILYFKRPKTIIS